MFRVRGQGCKLRVEGLKLPGHDLKLLGNYACANSLFLALTAKCYAAT